MRRVVEYKDEYEKAWTDYINKSPRSSVSHQIGLRNVIAAGLGCKPKYLLAFEDEKVTGVLPLFLLRTWWNAAYLISVPWLDYGGICADDRDSEEILFQSAQEIAKKEKVEFIEFRSQEKSGLTLVDHQEKVTFLLDLAPGAESIWKGFDSKLRNQIRKSQNSGLSVHYGGTELLSEFYRVFAWKMHELGTPVWGRSLFENLLTAIPAGAQIAIVRKDDITVTGALLLTFKDRQYVPSASSYRPYLKLCPYHALYWDIIERGAKSGYKYFDFGRSSIDSPTYNFKKQWAETPTPLEWQYSLNRVSEVPRINPSNPKYRLAKYVWSRLPLPLANLLGPAVIKNFP